MRPAGAIQTLAGFDQWDVFRPNCPDGPDLVFPAVDDCLPLPYSRQHVSFAMPAPMNRGRAKSRCRKRPGRTAQPIGSARFRTYVLALVILVPGGCRAFR